MRLHRFLPIPIALAILALVPARPAGTDPRDPVLALIQRMDLFFHRHETDGVTRDPRNLRNPPEEIRLSVVPQLLGYCELYRTFPNLPCYQDIVDRADFLSDNADLATAGGATDGMLAFALLSAHAITGNDRYRAVAQPILDRCMTLRGFDVRLNWGLMAAMGLAERYRQTGDPAALQKVREIVAGVAAEQHADGSFPHYCQGSRDIHYTAWMAMELMLIGQRVQDPTLERVLASAAGFLRVRVDPAGATHYEDAVASGGAAYYFSRATGCWFDYDTRGWVNELGYTAMLFDHFREPRYHAVVERLRDLQDDGAYSDKWDFLPPPADPIYPWASENHSVIRTSVIFWSLASLYAEREHRGPAHYVAHVADPPGGSGAGAGGIGTARTAGVSAAGDGATAPAGFGLDPAAPNPARGGCAALLRLPRAMEVRTEVFDVSGRRVRALGAGAMPGGERLLRWDGRDDRGGRVPPGLYLLRVRAGILQAVTRVVIAS